MIIEQPAGIWDRRFLNDKAEKGMDATKRFVRPLSPVVVPPDGGGMKVGKWPTFNLFVSI